MSSPLTMPTPAAIPMIPFRTPLERLRDAAPVPVPTPPPLDRADYPDCKSWTETDWKKWVAEGRENDLLESGVPGKGVNSSWLEDQNGIRPDLCRQKVILQEVRRTWVTMRDFGIGLAPQTDMPGPTFDYFRKRIESKFPEFRLCADHWKAVQVWKENFSSWTPPKPTKQLQGDSTGVPQPELPSVKVSQF